MTFLPAAASPAAMPTRFCSAIPTSTICLRQRLAERAKLAGAARIAGDGNNLAVVFGQCQERIGEFFEVRAAHLQAELARPWLSRRA